MTTAFIYCRSAISDDQAISTQEAACRAYAQDNNLSVAGVFRDNGLSGSSAQRDELDKMIECIASQESECTVSTADLARLGRSHEVLTQLQDRIEDAGATITGVS